MNFDVNLQQSQIEKNKSEKTITKNISPIITIFLLLISLLLYSYLYQIQKKIKKKTRQSQKEKERFIKACNNYKRNALSFTYQLLPKPSKE